jgi:hypothetical protein
MSMTKRVNRWADRVLGQFLGHVEAGACVPEYGDLFWRNGCGTCSCVEGRRWVRKDCECRINCTGTCVNTGRTRCTTTQALC